MTKSVSHPISTLDQYQHSGLRPRADIGVSGWYVVWYRFCHVLFSIYFQVNNNGDITFENPLRQYTSNRFPINGSHKIIAPFWTDINTLNGGSLWYRTTKDKTVLQQGSNETRTLFPEFTDFSASWMMIVTWKDVAAHYCSHPSRPSCLRVQFLCLVEFTTFYITVQICYGLYGIKSILITFFLSPLRETLSS